MRINFKNWAQINSTRHLLGFVCAIVVISAVFVNSVSYLLLSERDFWANRLVANIEILALGISISYFVGAQIRKIVVLQERLEFALNHDPLTGAGTRSYMNSFLRQNDLMPCSVIMTDIDYFKKVNDQYGHQSGDVVLSEFVKILEQHICEADLVVRLGGEEFLIILPYTKLDTAAITAERMRRSIADANIMSNGNIVCVTASFGVGLLVSQSSIEDNINQADLALYDAKNSGRNRVCLAQH